jgi:integrase
MGAPLERTRTPGIYKRGSRYVFSYRVCGKQRWESARTLEEARRAKAARQTDIGRGEFEERSRVTFHDYATEWVQRYQGRGRRGFRDSTREDYRRMLRLYALRYFPVQTKLTEITPSLIAGFVAWTCDASKHDGRELSDATVRKILGPVRTCLATAVREGLIRHNPARDADLPNRATVNANDDEVRTLTREQVDTLLGLAHPSYRLFFEVLAVTGMRVSEAVGMQWRHLQLDGSTPHVKVRHAYVRGKLSPLKTRHSRRDIPLDHEIVVALRRHRAGSEWPDDEHHVFTTGAGTPLQVNNLRRRVLKPAAEEAGVPWAGFHTFRHTCASLLFAEGRNAVQVQRWLGHHSAAFTLATYVHLLDGDIGAPLTLATVTGVNSQQTDPAPLDATAGMLGLINEAA